MYDILKINLFLTLSLLLISCSGGGGGGSSSSSSSTFLDTGTSVTYSSTTASTHQQYDAYENVTGTSQSSHQNPYDQINAYQAYGYGFSGDGQKIAILDTYYDTDHYTYSDKTVTTYGDLTSDSTSDYHGNAVSGVAAGYLDTSYSGSVAAHGVAYDADLHLSDYQQKGSNTYYADHWALATTDAKNSSAVVQNNSWGFTDTAYNSSTSYSSSSIATLANASGFTSNGTSIDNYVTALNSFQDSGVVVYALSNSTSLSDADVAAALPEIYPQLNESWITAVNVDITGSSGNETYTTMSAKCGSTAAYCLGADGTYINAPVYYISGSYYDTVGVSGTSFVAPQISAGVAIMAEAFPNQTPDQWTDRLLASADNSFFTATSTTSFANGITHGYNTEFGHGIMDLNAALSPITSSKMKESILIGESLNNYEAHSLENSYLMTPKLFGDSLQRHFQNTTGVFHDALHGNFKYQFSNSFISQQSNNTVDQILNNHLNGYSFQDVAIKENSFKSSEGISFITKNTTNGYLSEINSNSFANFVSIGEEQIYTSLNMPIEISTGFVSKDVSNNIILNDGFANPFIPSNSFAFGTSMPLRDKERDIYVSFYNNEINELENPSSGLVVTKKVLDEKDISSSFMFGYNIEQNSFVGASSKGAFNQNNNTPTIFISHSFEKIINDKTDFSLISTLGRTQYNNSNTSTLLNDISPIISSSFGAVIKHDINLDDQITLKLSQPHRLESGTTKISIPQLNDIDGSLNFNYESVKLNPSGRQIDLSFRYDKEIIEESMIISFENITSRDEGHISSSQINNKSIISINYRF